MSPELETPDLLQAGDMPLAEIRRVFADPVHFVRALEFMLEEGEVRLLAADGTEVSRWAWRDRLKGREEARLSLTEKGARRS
jgi:hypothetical protein